MTDRWKAARGFPAAQSLRVKVSTYGRTYTGARMKLLLRKLWKEQEGQDLTEYALLLVLLSLAAVGSIGGLANAVNGVFANAAANLST